MEGNFDITVFARKCDITGKGMNEGYCFGNGELYAKDIQSARVIVQKYGFKDLLEAYDEEWCYWTEWEFSDVMYQGYYYDENGNEIDFI
jgi:hypothetical protein